MRTLLLTNLVLFPAILLEGFYIEGEVWQPSRLGILGMRRFSFESELGSLLRSLAGRKSICLYET